MCHLWLKNALDKNKLNYSVFNVTESLSVIEDETLCDEEVNIILMTNE